MTELHLVTWHSYSSKKLRLVNIFFSKETQNRVFFLTVAPRQRFTKEKTEGIRLYHLIHNKGVWLTPCCVFQSLMATVDFPLFESLRGHPEIFTPSTYEITYGITLLCSIFIIEKNDQTCKKYECHHIWWFVTLISIETDSPNWLQQIMPPIPVKNVDLISSGGWVKKVMKHQLM